MAKKKSTTRRILFILAGLVVVLLILAVVAASFMNRGGDGLTVETATAEIRTITQVVTSSGKVQPEVEIVISPDVSGEIIQLPVKEGDQVRKGALLARIKPDFYSAQVEQAEANVLQSKAMQAQRQADLLNAEAELNRQKSLFEKNVSSESAYQQAKTQYDISKAALDAAKFSVQSTEARLREAREQLNKTVLYAPMDGTVSQLNVELGERVVGTTQMAGTQMMIIARLDQMELEVDINENDVVNVVLGDTASIEIDAYPERSFRGVVTEIANSARLLGAGTQEQVTNFPVKIRILDPHNAEARSAVAGTGGVTLDQEVPLSKESYPSFRPGMSGTVDIYTKTVEEVVAVPIQTVTVRDFNQMREDLRRSQADSTETATDEEAAEEEEEDVPELLQEEDLRKVIFIMDESEARVVEVETGIADDRFIEVKSGLEGGEKVITGPYSAVSRTLRPGMDVKERSRRRGRRGRGGPPSAP
ncbi:MAG: efflux RND transporter periplasmic adaptor subunit [Rhodothermales bacterium]